MHGLKELLIDHLWIQCISQPVSHERETEHSQRNKERWKESKMPIERHIGHAIAAEHLAPARRRGIDAHTQEAQRSFGENRLGNTQRHRYDDGSDGLAGAV